MRTLIKFLAIIFSGPVLMILHHETAPGWPLSWCGVTDTFYNNGLWGAAACIVVSLMICSGVICFGGDEYNPYFTHEQRMRALERKKRKKG